LVPDGTPIFRSKLFSSFSQRTARRETAVADTDLTDAVPSRRKFDNHDPTFTLCQSQKMKFVEPNCFTTPDAAARKMVEIANGIELFG
jgi:hypothetical protein